MRRATPWPTSSTSGPAPSTWKPYPITTRRCSASTGLNTRSKQSEGPMTLTESLLPKLSDWRPAGDGRHSWSAAFPAAGWTVCVAADKADTLSCLVWELTLTRTAEAPAGLTLQAWAAAVAHRVTGLLEPL